MTPQPLLLGDPDALARKLAGSAGLLRGYWEDFQSRFLADPASRAQMIFLPALLDGTGLDEARATLRRDWQTLAADAAAGDVQFHAWCRCGAATRRAAFFDWLAARGAWSAADVEEAAESFVGFAYQHAFPVLVGRTRVSNNQALSLALHCAVVGFLFGQKLARHPTAQFLFEHGMHWLPDLIGLFPADGYGGEGSTYTSHVNTPLACWTADFLRQVTGRDWLDVPFRPNGTTLQRIIEMELRLLSPGGLLAPWDHYGWQRAINGSPFSYLARATGNPRHLALIPSLTDESNPGLLAWGADDPLWTLVWWPEQFAGYHETEVPRELFGWFLPRTGAALDDVPRRARLMQVWDYCAGNITGIGRLQCNPNHLMFDYDREPVFQDGSPVSGLDPWRLPSEKVLATLDDGPRERFLAYLSSSGSSSASKIRTGTLPGLIGAANAIVVDDEPWYWPGQLCVGRPEQYARENGSQIVRADCALFYQPRYDVTQACRASLWSDDGFGVVHDLLRADSPHTWQWQVHLRPNLAREDHSVRVRLSNGKEVLLAWAPVAETRLSTLEGFPKTDEQRCVRLELRQQGVAAEFAVLIAPGAGSASIRPVGDARFEIRIDGRTQTVSLAQPANVVSPVPDVHELPDILLDHDAQFPEFEPRACGEMPAPAEGGSELAQVDACFAQLAAPQPDANLLRTALENPCWPVQMAAAEALGRRGLREAAPALRALLEREHADRELYATGTVKRWRLKTAVIVALGRLGDRECVPLLRAILAEGRDFYPVYSVIAQALGRIGGPGAREALTLALRESEHNTHLRARAALKHLEKGSKL
ncbi:MAG: hypothetical protein IT578_09740 [Verrucomicrobiae bacterium]|nr:hypothetical protein [Verrucomicrobiae bacterium]